MKNIQDITPSEVKRAYKGKIGCMCGCKGKYYEPGDAMVTKILRTIQANEERVVVDDRGDWVAMQLAGKEHCVYLND